MTITCSFLIWFRWVVSSLFAFTNQFSYLPLNGFSLCFVIDFLA
jgi:hypothetical protein